MLVVLPYALEGVATFTRSVCVDGGGANNLRRLARRQVAACNTVCVFSPPREATLISTTSGSNVISQSCCCLCSCPCPPPSTSPRSGESRRGANRAPRTCRPVEAPDACSRPSARLLQPIYKRWPGVTEKTGGIGPQTDSAILINNSRLGPALKQKKQGLMLLKVGSESKQSAAER